MDVKDIFGNFPVLETERLLLRKITQADTKDIYHYGKNPTVSQYVPWKPHKSMKDTEAYVEFVLRKYDNGELAPWGIEYKENGRLIGTIDFVSWNLRHKTAEIGYVVSHDYWGKGIATEAAKEVIKFGFEKMDLVRIEAKCFVENIASIRVMEKSGMSYEGTLRKVMFIKGKHRDLKVYSILRDEYYSKNILKN